AAVCDLAFAAVPDSDVGADLDGAEDSKAMLARAAALDLFRVAAAAPVAGFVVLLLVAIVLSVPPEPKTLAGRG
ncbi:MAG: hypothetical protein ACK4XK_09065, partial [Casimicrobiaceae bacterium]